MIELHAGAAFRWSYRLLKIVCRCWCISVFYSKRMGCSPFLSLYESPGSSNDLPNFFSMLRRDAGHDISSVDLLYLSCPLCRTRTIERKPRISLNIIGSVDWLWGGVPNLSTTVVFLTERCVDSSIESSQMSGRGQLLSRVTSREQRAIFCLYYR